RQRKPKQVQTKSRQAPRPIDRSRELRQEARGNKLLQPLQSAMFRAHKERNQEGDNQQAPKPFWCAEGHEIAKCRLPIADCVSRLLEFDPRALNVARSLLTVVSFRRSVTKAFAPLAARNHPSDTAERDRGIADIF